MKNRMIKCAVLIGIAFGVASCGSTNSSIGYKEASRYFVRNDVKDYSPRLLQSAEELNRFFGTAPVMGKDGMPTNIDFQKYNVAALIDKETNVDTDLKVSSIKKVENQVVVKYQVIRKGSPRSFSTVPCRLLLIEKKYGNHVVFVKE